VQLPSVIEETKRVRFKDSKSRGMWKRTRPQRIIIHAHSKNLLRGPGMGNYFRTPGSETRPLKRGLGEFLRSRTSSSVGDAGQLEAFAGNKKRGAGRELIRGAFSKHHRKVGEKEIRGMGQEKRSNSAWQRAC